MEYYLGQIILGGWNFAPRGTAFCNGQSLLISMNSALFSLLGTTFGGDGQATFGLPNMQGKFPMPTSDPKHDPYIKIGQKEGSDEHFFTKDEMPQHNHKVTAGGGLNIGKLPRSNDPNGHWVGNQAPAETNPIYRTSSGTEVLAGIEGVNLTLKNSCGTSTGVSPVFIMNPYVAINFCIALAGIYPSRR